MAVNQQKKKLALRIRRKQRVRARVQGTAARPRFSVFRSHTRMFLQLIDDEAGTTLIGFSDATVEPTAEYEGHVGVKTLRAYAAGKALAVRAKERGITTVVFDRNGYAYLGRVRAVADGARQGGLQF